MDVLTSCFFLSAQVTNQPREAEKVVTREANEDEAKGDEEQEWKGIDFDTSSNIPQKSRLKKTGANEMKTKRLTTQAATSKCSTENEFALLLDQDKDGKNSIDLISAPLSNTLSITTSLGVSRTLTTNSSCLVADVIYISNSHTIGCDT